MMREGEMSLTTKTITPPQFFTCPISLELFSEPVTLCTGQTYDRFYIEKWFSAGNLTCPVTMQKLHDLSLVPNHTLTHLINQWLQKTENDQIYDDFGRIEEFKHVLESEDCSVQQKIGVLEKVGNFSEYLLRRNVGLFSILLGLIFGEEISEEKMVLIEKSLDCALKLMPFCCMNDDNLMSILLLEESKFENFRVLFKDGSVLVKVGLCNFIEVIFTSSSSLSLSQSSQALANKIANDSVLLQTLISSLQDNTAEVSEASIKAILSILSCTKQSYRENMLKEGLINALVTHILEENNSVTHKATKALEMMVELESGKQVLLVRTNEVKNTVKALIKMVFRVSGNDECSESAVNCLMKLCCESTEVREAAICGGVLTQLLLLLQSQCCGRVKTKARLLLKLLRCMWVKDPKQHV